MKFDLTDLRLFVLVADEGSLTRAAKRQHLSLAAASTRIKSLEVQSGQTLLYREARGVRLTPPGEAFFTTPGVCCARWSNYALTCRSTELACAATYAFLPTPQRSRIFCLKSFQAFFQTIRA